MSKIKDASYEQMFMNDYYDYVFKNITSEKYQMPKEGGANVINVASDVAKEVGSAVGESAQQYGKYMQETPLKESIPTTLNELGKGLVSGALGIGGDLEHLVRGAYSALQTKEGQSKLESFLQGLGQETVLPATEDVSKKLDKVTGEPVKGAGLIEGTGELVAPAGAIVKAAKGTAKAIKKMKAK
jgi:hypothetical protein